MHTPDGIDDWVSAAKRGELSWIELAERLLGLEQRPGQLHQPDLDRSRRCGLAEVVFGSGKSPDAISEIAHKLLDSGTSEVLATRIDPWQFASLWAAFPFSRYDSLGRTLRVSQMPIQAVRKADSQPYGEVAAVSVVTAGSTDLPIAREAVETLGWMGVASELICDVGVAGPYRILARIQSLRKCVAIVVIAGMEGALVSLVGGLVNCPVIAVPTSIGYGANLAGVTTLLSMLSSCAAGVTVVNIDAGFKGGYVAGLIARQTLKR